MLGTKVAKKCKWGEMTWQVVAEVHDKEEIPEPTNIGLQDFNFEATLETIFAEMYFLPSTNTL